MKTLKFRLGTLLIVVSALVACNSTKDEPTEDDFTYNKVRTAEGFDELIIGQGANVQILDFRSEADFDAGHIPDAINITATVQNTASDNGEFAQRVLQEFDNNRPIFIYGRNDLNLEYIVPGRISRIGFRQSNTYILLGGFNVWIAAFPDKVETGEF